MNSSKIAFEEFLQQLQADEEGYSITTEAEKLDHDNRRVHVQAIADMRRSLTRVLDLSDEELEKILAKVSESYSNVTRESSNWGFIRLSGKVISCVTFLQQKKTKQERLVYIERWKLEKTKL